MPEHTLTATSDPIPADTARSLGIALVQAADGTGQALRITSTEGRSTVAQELAVARARVAELEAENEAVDQGRPEALDQLLAVVAQALPDEPIEEQLAAAERAHRRAHRVAVRATRRVRELAAQCVYLESDAVLVAAQRERDRFRDRLGSTAAALDTARERIAELETAEEWWVRESAAHVREMGLLRTRADDLQRQIGSTLAATEAEMRRQAARADAAEAREAAARALADRWRASTERDGTGGRVDQIADAVEICAEELEETLDAAGTPAEPAGPRYRQAR